MNIKKIISISMSTLVFLQCSCGSNISTSRALGGKQGISNKAKFILGGCVGTVGLTTVGVILWNLFHGGDGSNGKDKPQNLSDDPINKINTGDDEENNPHNADDSNDESISSLKDALNANCGANLKIQTFRKLLGHYVSENEKIDISADDVLHVCKNIIPVLDKELNVLDIDGPTLMVGDTHSNVFDTKIYIEEFLKLLEKDSNTKILFLGDYVDRGQQCVHGGEGVKNLIILYTLKTMFPDNVFLLRGNHEDKSICSVSYAQNSMGDIVELIGDTKKECNTIYGNDGQKLFDSICDTFKYLPLAAIVNGDTFCVHGGIPGHEFYYPDIEVSNRKIEEVPTYDGIMSRMLWSDPCDDGRNEPSYYESKRGAGVLFNGAAVSEFLNRNSLERIIRAHEVAPNGYNPMFDGKLITLFSSSGYSLDQRNRDKDSGVLTGMDDKLRNNTAAIIYYERENVPLKVAILRFSESQQDRKLSEFIEIQNN